MSREKIFPPISAEMLYTELTIPSKGNDFDIILPDESEFSIIERSYDKETRLTTVKIGRVCPTVQVVWGFKTEARVGGKDKILRVNGYAETSLPLVKHLAERLPSDVFDYSKQEGYKAKTLYTYAQNGSGACEYIRAKLVPAFKSELHKCAKEIENKIGERTNEDMLAKRLRESDVIAKLKSELFAHINDVFVNSIVLEDTDSRINGIKQSISTYMPSVFSIRGNGGSGTGFVFDIKDAGEEYEKVKQGDAEWFVGEDGELYDKEPSGKRLVSREMVRLYAVTCRHVLFDDSLKKKEGLVAVLSGGISEYKIENAECLEIEYGRKLDFEIKDVCNHRDISMDVAMFTVRVPKDMLGAIEKISIMLNDETAEQYRTMCIDQANKPRLVLLGNNLGRGIKALEGELLDTVAGEGLRALMTNVHSNQGCSGGPVLDENGKCVGILQERVQKSKNALIQDCVLAIATYDEDNIKDLIKLKEKLDESVKKSASSSGKSEK